MALTRTNEAAHAAQFRDSLPPLQRLALSYAPAATRDALLALIALDARLAGIVRSSREPMLAQLRLAWWREQLGSGSAVAGSGDPLLDLLRRWRGPAAALAALSDGWEAMTGPAPLPPEAFMTLAEARAAALAALADSPDARRMGRNWALADIAAHLSDPREQGAALALARAQDWRQARLPRSLRPLAVLHRLAASAIWRENPAAAPNRMALLSAMRIGLIGR